MIWDVIKKAMKRNDIRSISDLAYLTGINPSTLQHTRRKKPRSFILWELLQLDRVLGFTEEEWEAIRT